MPDNSALPPADQPGGEASIAAGAPTATRRALLGSMAGVAVLPLLDAAPLAAATAQAASNFYGTARYGNPALAVAAGEAATIPGALFSIDDGNGNLIYRERTTAASVEVARTVSPAALAESGGSGGVGFTQIGDGAMRRSVETELRERPVSVRQFGAVGDGVADDSAAIRKADLACGERRPLYFPPGTYLVSRDGSNGWCLLKKASNRWFGDGMGRSVICPSPKLPDTCDVVREIASTNFENRGGGCTDIGILNPTNGTRAGRHGWHVDTTARNVNQQINGNSYIRLATGMPSAASPGYGFCHTNAGGNTEGGMYASSLADCVLGGGFCFIKTGDSIWVTNVRCSGPLPNVIDQVVNVNGPGNTFTLTGCNITNDGGLLKVTNAPGLVVRGMNGENFGAGAARHNGSAAVWLKAPEAWSGRAAYAIGDLVLAGNQAYRSVAANSGQPLTNARYWAPYDPFENASFEENLISIAGRFDGSTLVRVGCGNGITFQKNRMGVGLTRISAFAVEEAVQSIDLRKNTYPLGVANKLAPPRPSITFDNHGEAVQPGSKGEPITLDTASGQIIMHNASLAPGAAVGFFLNNGLIGANDMVFVMQKSGGTVNAYHVSVDVVTDRRCRINVRNVSPGALAEALVIGFVIMKAGQR